MSKNFLSIMVCALLMTACGGQATSIPTVTVIPLSPSIVPSPVTLSPTLLVEKALETETGTSYSLDWSSDGETLAVASGVEITLLSHDLIKIISNFKPSSGALTATWSPDQKNLATVVGFRNPKFTLWNWDAANAQLSLAQEISADSDQYSASWSPDGKLLATLANDRKSIIQIWDTSTWKLLHKFDLPYANPRRALDWSADSKTIYDAGELDGIGVYFAMNVEDGSVQELGKLPVEQMYAFSISPDSKRIAVADQRGMVRIFEVGSDNSLAEFQSIDDPADLAWNPEGAKLVILGYKATLQLWSVVP